MMHQNRCHVALAGSMSSAAIVVLAILAFCLLPFAEAGDEDTRSGGMSKIVLEDEAAAGVLAETSTAMNVRAFDLYAVTVKIRS